MASALKPILLIEDSEDIREAFVGWMELEGCRAKSCGNAQQALQILRGEFEPSLIQVNLITL